MWVPALAQVSAGIAELWSGALPGPTERPRWAWDGSVGVQTEMGAGWGSGRARAGTGDLSLMAHRSTSRRRRWYPFSYGLVRTRP
jgi:hypothetical protein